MEYTISKKPEMKFIGIGIETSVQNASKECPVLWKNFMERLDEIKSVDKMKSYGICVNPNNDTCKFRYVACSEVEDFSKIPENMEQIELPEKEFMIFIHKGKLEKLGNTYAEIMKLIPEPNYEYWIEFYDERWKGDKEESEFEIWIPK